MATLALSIAGQFAGGLVGGPFGATIGRALGALAGSAIDNAIFAEDPKVSIPTPFMLQGSSEGGAIPKIYGWNRITGNIIWATNLDRQTTETAGSKGLGNTQAKEEVIANFAIGLCEGEVAHLGRIWADGRLLETEGLTLRFYRGTRTQAADSLIVTKQGVDNSPAYRGLCYLVFEGLPLGEFGNRIPNISVELCRVVGDLEPAIKAITLIPGATEFGYDPEPRVRVVSPGKSENENTSLLGQTSDWTISIDELQALCPNLEHVALVVAWFGDDLRCGQCKIQPRVESTVKNTTGTHWIVSGKARNEVPVMTSHQGGPAYGGTPSDASVLAAIADLKSRGIKVTLYPFILMDIANTNTLVDPYSGSTGQPAYPWRGRITCAPAPGEVGSPDKSAAMNAQVNGFVGTAIAGDFSATTDTINYSGSSDWGYRRMILHYAKLVVLAGGVDAFLIGSELRGLTWLRNSATSFPFVDALVNLAGDVRAIVGGTTKLTYGADWSEYSGMQPPETPGDKLFHLDPLWASAPIDAIGIDNYMPLSDWRGNGNEPDAAIAKHPHQLDYLSANIAGGEGFDWYYASDADRLGATRTPITDGPAAEPWIWKVKDIKSWWLNAHHNRVNGVRSASATSWVPQSKPIWFSELGCGAVDKGPNTPNVFGDEKSVENAKPYFSDGTPDALAQRQFLRAHHQWWQPGSPGYDPANNPGSTQYVGQMIDPERIYVWTWDARPYPAFPVRTDIWSDGVNHQTGHWLTGRFGALAAEEFLSAIARDYGIVFATLEAGAPHIQGVQIANIVSLRRAIEPMLEATGLLMRDTQAGVSILNPYGTEKIEVSAKFLVADSVPVMSRKSSNKDETIGQLALTYLDRSVDYQSSTVTAIADLSPVQSGTSTNLVLEGATARYAVQTMLAQHQLADSLEIKLPLSMLALDVGDAIKIGEFGREFGKEFFKITSMRQGNSLSLTAQMQNEVPVTFVDADMKIPALRLPHISAVPEIVTAHIPGVGGDMNGTRVLLGAFADPWPGEIAIVNDAGGDVIARLEQRATMGELGTLPGTASSVLWDYANQITVNIFGGHLSSRSKVDVMNGANRLAISKDNGSWEIIGFATAELISAGQYRLKSLLRGLNNTGIATNELASIGNRVILLDNALTYISIENGQLEAILPLTAYAGGPDHIGQPLIYSLDNNLVKPLPPTHLRATRIGVSENIALNWVRRTQIGGDSWSGVEVPLDFMPEAFVVSIFDGASLKRQITSAGEQVIYSSADQTTDFGSTLPAFDFSVQQVSAVHGAGNVTSASFSS